MSRNKRALLEHEKVESCVIVKFNLVLTRPTHSRKTLPKAHRTQGIDALNFVDFLSQSKSLGQTSTGFVCICTKGGFFNCPSPIMPFVFFWHQLGFCFVQTTTTWLFFVPTTTIWILFCLSNKNMAFILL